MNSTSPSPTFSRAIDQLATLFVQIRHECEFPGKLTPPLQDAIHVRELFRPAARRGGPPDRCGPRPRRGRGRIDRRRSRPPPSGPSARSNRARKSNAAARESELGRIDETPRHRPPARSSGSTIPSSSPPIAAATIAAPRPTEKFKAAEQRGRTEHDDRLWHIDSMLEAGEKAAKEQLESLQRKAAGGTEQIAAHLEPRPNRRWPAAA